MARRRLLRAAGGRLGRRSGGARVCTHPELGGEVFDVLLQWIGKLAWRSGIGGKPQGYWRRLEAAVNCRSEVDRGFDCARSKMSKGPHRRGVMSNRNVEPGHI